MLIAGVSRLLKRKKYRPTTLESYHLTWRRIKDYMIAQNIQAFTKDVGEAFTKNWFGDRSYDSLKMHEKNYIYYTTVLWYYQQNHTLPPNIKKKPDFAFTGKLGALFNEFLVYKSETCAPPTLRLYRYRLYPLYDDLLRSKKEVATLDGPYLVRFLSRLDMTQTIKEKNRMIEQTGMFLTTNNTCFLIRQMYKSK